MDDGLLYILGPGQDMFNHSVEAPHGSEDVVLLGSGEERALVIRAFKDFAAGEQAFYSYSGSCNGRLLMLAGFVLPDNPNDSVELAFTFSTSATRPACRSSTRSRGAWKPACPPPKRQVRRSHHLGRRSCGSGAADVYYYFLSLRWWCCWRGICGGGFLWCWFSFVLEK